jgi:hypothetical protein
MKSKFILFAFISIFAFACKKDKVAPALTIGGPGDGAQASGIVVITGTVTDENLKTMTLRITKDASGAELYSKTLSLDGLTVYNYNEQYDPGVIVTPTNVTLTIKVSDKNGSETSKIVKFTLIP